MSCHVMSCHVMCLSRGSTVVVMYVYLCLFALQSSMQYINDEGAFTQCQRCWHLHVRKRNWQASCLLWNLHSHTSGKDTVCCSNRSAGLSDRHLLIKERKIVPQGRSGFSSARLNNCTFSSMKWSPPLECSSWPRSWHPSCVGEGDGVYDVYGVYGVYGV